MTWGRFVVRVDAPDIQGALDKIGAFNGRARKKIEDAVEKSTGNVQAGAQARVARKSGKTKASIKKKFDRNKVVGEVFTKRPTGHLIELGTKPHEIEARRAKALTIKGGFARRVHHPGTAAKPFMKPAADAEMPKLVRNITEAVKP